jgi:hypothetical protein
MIRPGRRKDQEMLHSLRRFRVCRHEQIVFTKKPVEVRGHVFEPAKRCSRQFMAVRKLR